jgi:Leucine-rich repeat (LRR) protein
VLDVSDNQLSALPDEIGQLAKLQTLDLSGNQLHILPSAIGMLSRLQALDVSGNPLNTVPEPVGQLIKGQPNGDYPLEEKRHLKTTRVYPFYFSFICNSYSKHLLLHWDRWRRERLYPRQGGS